MKTPLSVLLLGLGLATFSGCQNPYAQSYANTMPPGTEAYLRPSAGSPDIQPVAVTELADTMKKMERRGYVIIGHASFTADADDYTNELRSKALEVKADVVLTTAIPAGARSEAQGQAAYDPMQNIGPTSGGQVTASGMRGVNPGVAAPAPVGLIGNMAPTYDVHTHPQNKYAAVFLRQRAFVLGANVGPLTEAPPPGGTPAPGVLVVSVIEDSPAARAGIVPGDILTAVEGAAFGSLLEYQKLVNARAGGPAHITLQRRGAEQTVLVQLNALPHAR